jgi:hypothetical protein
VQQHMLSHGSFAMHPGQDVPTVCFRDTHAHCVCLLVG